MSSLLYRNILCSFLRAKDQISHQTFILQQVKITDFVETSLEVTVILNILYYKRNGDEPTISSNLGCKLALSMAITRKIILDILYSACSLSFSTIT